jgi:hypothetical protein
LEAWLRSSCLVLTSNTRYLKRGTAIEELGSQFWLHKWV